MGPAGNPVAFGCEISPEIQGREAVTMTVALGQYPLDIDGDYTFATDLHLNEALPPPADEIVARVEQFFVDPAGLVLYYIGEYPAANTTITAEQFENATRAAGVSGYDSIEEALYANVIDRLPSEVIATMNVGGDVVGLMNNLRVGGDMLLSNNDGIVSGRYGWQTFSSLGVLVASVTSRTPAVVVLLFSGEEVGLEPVGAALAGVFEEIEVERGSAPRGTVAIDEHRLDLQYGNLILFTLNQFVLPALTGQDNLACGIESIMGWVSRVEALFAVVLTSVLADVTESLTGWQPTFHRFHLIQRLSHRVVRWACKRLRTWSKMEPSRIQRRR